MAMGPLKTSRPTNAPKVLYDCYNVLYVHAELALVSRGPQPVEEVEPYIEHNTFIPILYTRQADPQPPKAQAPRLPPRLDTRHPAPGTSHQKKGHAGCDAAEFRGVSHTKDCAQSDYEYVYHVPAEPGQAARKRTLDSLSIDDVSLKLKQLGLKKYAGKFRKSCIDGVLLQKLTEKVLMSDFRMSQLEIILLNTFIADGHIPRKSRENPSGRLP